MNAVGAAVTVEKLALSGNECMKIGRKVIEENEELKREFLECCTDSALEQKEKDNIYNGLVTKVCNARFGAVLKIYKDRTIGRQGNKRADQALRSKLKSVTSNEAGK